MKYMKVKSNPPERDRKDYNRKPLGDLLQRFVRSNNLERGLEHAKLSHEWPKLMGTLIDNYTERVYVRNEILYLKVSSSVLREELMRNKTIVIEKVNGLLGPDTVKDVNLR